jgi:hypothetical protein
MSSVSSYQSLPSTSSNATVRRKPFPTALNVLNRNEAKVKHKWQAGRLVLATLETNPRPSPLEETNTAIGNKDDKWSDEYMKQMDQRVLEPMFRNCRNAFATSAKAERLGLASGDIKLTQRLDGQVGIGDDSSEEVEEKDQDSDEELAQTQAREVHFAGDQSAAQTNKNLRRGPTRGEYWIGVDTTNCLMTQLSFFNRLCSDISLQPASS